MQTQLAEREKAEEAVRQSEEKYRTLIEHNPDVIIRYDRHARHVYANPAIKNLTNIPPENMLGKTPEEVNFPQDHAKNWEERIRGIFKTGKPAFIEIETGAGENHRFYDWILIPEFGPDRTVESVLSTSRDVTARRMAQEELRLKIAELEEKDQYLSKSLAEKEVLLAEIHHRVKNNLSAFIALLSLEGTYDDTTPSGRLLKIDLQNRARSMALVHDILYRTKTYSTVDMELYLKNLVGQIVASYALPKNIRSIVDVQGVSLDLDIATPCGLIVTELVTNVLKYAFPPAFDCMDKRNEPCTLTVSLKKTGETNVLTVSDNGIGLPRDFDPKTAKTLGLKLVNFLARHQLRATVEVHTDHGTEFTLRFPEHQIIPEK